MGKRSDFKRRARDVYKTPEKGLAPLLPHLDIPTTFIEPCAGDGRLVKWLEEAGHNCAAASDIKPQRLLAGNLKIRKKDALTAQFPPATVITNTPWRTEVLHPMLENFLRYCPQVWLLLPADYAHTVQAIPFMARCRKVVSVGRLKWMPRSKHTGFENCAWYLFQPRKCKTIFYGRTK